MSKEKESDRLVLDSRQSQNGSAMPDVISKTNSPLTAAVHILLKAAIVAAYLLIPLITDKDFTLLFIVVVAGAIDFWIVKNLAGRLLVGLRWWIDFDEEGDEQWKFECKVDERSIGAASEKAFWWTLYLFCLIWVFLSVINVLKINLTHITICLFCMVLLVFNTYSYYKCSKVQSENVQRLMNQYGAQAAGRFMGGSIIAGFT